ncbi:16S rRNA (cytosine(1402)-N(4))-methyltransferase RsmH [Alloacidobacterium sp.]|uniref:16S rRNA (cytosine(1402)-N(4))-methyltransferase RsmH n=1 Tax=Alloacidobacterium sp. TaxID=2951999 RepID=UPI002D503B94|nr:16S rRNA (cytosine(1402)-N(4))-methyltransferase RsmH [Alloacidobacterium sp.]HYK36815.1 16S rRNA (cytosine(1402)-N(4))-methyltransferase RsmH [Alloacidobacterium sp.]
MTERERHVPVLLKEAIRYLNVRPGGTYCDATLGLAGHSSAIARQLGPQGKLIGFDRDPEAMVLAQERLDDFRETLGPAMPEVVLHDVEFSQAEKLLEPESLDGLLADFGVSSLQFDEAHRGFSFQADGPLEMRMNPRQGVTAEQVVNQAGEKELADLIYEFGEERRSRRIARAIVRARPITTTAQLARIVTAAAPAMKSDRIHPATRTFQALRIYVNAELDEIDALLSAAPGLLKPGGRLVVISFHSLEDRRAKDALREGARQGLYEVLTRKPVTAEAEETDRNPRARSAKLRAAEKKAGHSAQGAGHRR